MNCLLTSDSIAVFSYYSDDFGYNYRSQEEEKGVYGDSTMGLMMMMIMLLLMMLLLLLMLM